MSQCVPVCRGALSVEAVVNTRPTEVCCTPPLSTLIGIVHSSVFSDCPLSDALYQFGVISHFDFNYIYYHWVDLLNSECGV